MGSETGDASPTRRLTVTATMTSTAFDTTVDESDRETDQTSEYTTRELGHGLNKYPDMR